MSEEAAIVLAAGQGTRMNSSLPKVLHDLAGRSLLGRVLDALRDAGFTSPTVVVGYGAELVRTATGDRCQYVVQPDQRGTGDAVRVALETVPSDVTRIVVAHGDEPMLTGEIYRSMIDIQEESGAAVVLLTTHTEDTRDFGRVARNEEGAVLALRQTEDLSESERNLDEVNLGAYVFDATFLRDHIAGLHPHQPKGELYFTDLVEIASQADLPVKVLNVPGGTALMGINDLLQLEQAAQLVYRQMNERFMRAGVSILDSRSTFITDEVEIEPDTVIQPFSVISGRTRIGKGCRIGPSARIHESDIGHECSVVASTIDSSKLGPMVSVGPYAHVRGGAHIESGVEVGTHSEIKGSRIGARTKMHHFGYVGDADVGADVNIGAGTITLNFDGVNKHRTVIEDGVFVGSDTLLRAPVRLGKGSATGAGSVVTRDVPAGKLAVGMPARSIKWIDRDKSSGESDGES